MKFFKKRSRLENLQTKGPDIRKPKGIKEITLEVKGFNVGKAELVIGKAERENYAFLYYIEVDPAHRGQGLGSFLLEQVNNFLRRTGRIGLLQNQISPSEHAAGIYERHGWLPIPHEQYQGWMYYPTRNIPEHILPRLIEDAKGRTNRILERL